MNSKVNAQRRKCLVDSRAKLRATLKAALGLTLERPRDENEKHDPIQLVAGPRAGTLLIAAGLNSQKVLEYLRASDCAVARQMLLWDFPGAPSVAMDGAFIRLEATWPRDLADTNIDLLALNPHPLGYGRWVIAQNEVGDLVVGKLDDQTPHWLIGGTSGSGKTTAILSLVYQLSRPTPARTRADREKQEREDEAERAQRAGREPRPIVPENPDTYLVLIDGRNGAGLAPLAGLPHLIGPIATDVESATQAMRWAVGDIARRNDLVAEKGPDAIREEPYLVIVIDEFQELFQDATLRELVRHGLATGRGGRVHFILATQSPSMAAFGDDTSMRRNLAGRIALRVTDGDASRVVMGNSDYAADRLAGRGDCYIVTPDRTQRAQICYLDPHDIPTKHRPQLAEWPDAPLPEMSHEERKRKGLFNELELALALRAAAQNRGRDTLAAAVAAADLGGKPGGARGKRLLELGQKIRNELEALGYTLVERELAGACPAEAAPPAGAAPTPPPTVMVVTAPQARRVYRSYQAFQGNGNGGRA
ncbi:MAG TPA: FtsK/SpoIIIE domain-containing protein [Anaerolineae bacterium]|nr:FtsK/SpoIIIE domain-containing protein [Anaerolineae bacterium]